MSLENFTLGLRSEHRYAPHPDNKGTADTFAGYTLSGHVVTVFWFGPTDNKVVLAIREPIHIGVVRPDFGKSQIIKRLDTVGLDPMMLKCTLNEWEQMLAWSMPVIPPHHALAFGA